VVQRTTAYVDQVGQSLSTWYSPSLGKWQQGLSGNGDLDLVLNQNLCLHTDPVTDRPPQLVKKRASNQAASSVPHSSTCHDVTLLCVLLLPTSMTATLQT
jgi:hypothetical protein